MGLAPLLNPLHVLLSAEVIAIFLLLQPAFLTIGLAGFSALGF
jgi:hypothetical protein